MTIVCIEHEFVVASLMELSEWAGIAGSEGVGG